MLGKFFLIYKYGVDPLMCVTFICGFLNSRIKPLGLAIHTATIGFDNNFPEIIHGETFIPVGQKRGLMCYDDDRNLLMHLIRL